MKPISREMLQQAASSQPLKKTMQDYSQSMETLPHQVNGQSIQLSVPEWIHTKFLEAYSNKWPHTELPSTWIQGISVMTVKEIRNSVSKVLTDKKVMERLNGWPPSLPEFIALGGEDVDYDGAFYRCLNRKPEGRPEQFVFDNSAFNIRRMTQKEAEKFHKNELDKAIELEKRGLLRLNSEMPLQLTEHSTVNLNDIERENHKDKPHKFTDRINKLRKG